MHRRDVVLRAIAVFRLLKALLLIAGGLAALRLLHPEVAANVRDWIDRLPWAGEHLFVRMIAARITSLPAERIELTAIVAFCYAALFTIEGTGLWFGRVWAEYLTIIATTSFIPFEAWEVLVKTTAVRMFILAANVAIVIYLVVLRWHAGSSSGARPPSPRTRGEGSRG